MKKLIGIILTIAMALTLWACSCSSRRPAGAPLMTTSTAPSESPQPVATASPTPESTATTAPASMATAAPTKEADLPETENAPDTPAPDRLTTAAPELSAQQGQKQPAEDADLEDDDSDAEDVPTTRSHRWETEYDEFSHWKECIYCDKTTAPEPHSFDANGKCTECGYRCKHSYKDTVVAPTCTQEGYTVHTCSICGHTYRSDPVPAAGHSFVGKVETSAACTENGMERFVCSNCGESYTREIPATGHKPVTDPGEEATCQTEGKTEGSHCSVCGTVLISQETIPVCAHRFENGVCIWCKTKEPSDTPKPTDAPSPTPKPTDTPSPTPETVAPPWDPGNYELPEVPID